jgi:hypothetical protein
MNRDGAGLDPLPLRFAPAGDDSEALVIPGEPQAREGDP